MVTNHELRIGPDGWPAAIADSEGRQLVVGGPGTGKTEFLVSRIAALLEAGVASDEIIVLSFGRRSVHDLQHRLRTVVAQSLGAIEIARTINVTTAHARLDRPDMEPSSVAAWLLDLIPSPARRQGVGSTNMSERRNSG